MARLASREQAQGVRFAQTNVQLYNQLRGAGVPLEDLVLVHRAYELLTTLYPGYYQADGKPFVAHSVGVASILAALGQPAEIVAVGLLHNVYGNGDFRDGRGPGPWPSRRRLVREALDGRLEVLLARFAEQRFDHGDIGRTKRALPALDDAGRRLVLVDLADHLEKYLDLGCLYFGNNDWVLQATERDGPQLVEVAKELGEPRLAEMLSAAFAEAAAEARSVPPELRASDGRRFLKLVVPRSCKPRLDLRLRAMAGQARRGLRIRSRLRRLLGIPVRTTGA